jgi:hypothetical protein
MIFKSLPVGRATVAYQLKNQTAKVLIGDPRQTSRLIQASTFKQKYCGMTLGFEEEVLPADEAKIIDEFVTLIRGGLEFDALDILVVRHTDKKASNTGKTRFDYHITTVETELRTGKKITIYEAFRNRKCLDHDLFYAWERKVNMEYNYSRPDDPARRQTMQIPKNIGKDQKAVREAINKAVSEQVSAGRIKDRFDVMKFLEKAKFAIKRHGRDYLTIEDEDGKRLRLKGAFYDSGFDSSKLGKSATGGPAGADPGPVETLGDVEKRFSKLFAERVARFQKRYRTGPNKIKPAALGSVGDDSFVRVGDLVSDPDRRAVSPEIDRPGPIAVGKPTGIRSVAGTEPDSRRRPDEITGWPDDDRSETSARINHEKSTVGAVQDFLGKVGGIERRAQRANAVIDDRARGTFATTTGIFRGAAKALGEQGYRIAYANSGFRDTCAGFVQVFEAFDRAVKFARHPFGHLAQFLMQQILIKQPERRPVPPQIKPPRIS